MYLKISEERISPEARVETTSVEKPCVLQPQVSTAGAGNSFQPVLCPCPHEPHSWRQQQQAAITS